MTELIVKVTDYIFSDLNQIQKGLGVIMGGKVLELESDKLINQGIKQGIQQGLAQGENSLADLIKSY